MLHIYNPPANFMPKRMAMEQVKGISRFHGNEIIIKSIDCQLFMVRIMNAIRKEFAKRPKKTAGHSQQINRQIPLSLKNFSYAKWPALIRTTEYFEKEFYGSTAFP